MAAAISVRLDDEALGALTKLEASGLTRSEAIRAALVRSADELARRDRLRAEVEVLDADSADVEEMKAVASMMDQLRAEG
jgi:Arc/MetJ-type ribon-helix-helix transcriptional regulator